MTSPSKPQIEKGYTYCPYGPNGEDWTPPREKIMITIPNIKDEVSNGKKVQFKFYRKNELWYSTESGFQFPVPISDAGDATFLAEDKAILFMRYIRLHIESIKKEMGGKDHPENLKGES